MFIANGKKEVEFEGQKVARQIKIWNDDGKLFLGEGYIQIFSEVVEIDNGNVVVHKDPNPISLISLQQIPHDVLLKINSEGTEHITFAQLFQAICDMTDKIWANDFSNPIEEPIEEPIEDPIEDSTEDPIEDPIEE